MRSVGTFVSCIEIKISSLSQSTNLVTKVLRQIILILLFQICFRTKSIFSLVHKNGDYLKYADLSNSIKIFKFQACQKSLDLFDKIFNAHSLIHNS